METPIHAPMLQLLALVVLDLNYVMIRSWRRQDNLDSLYRFVARRAVIGVLVVVAMLVEPLLPGVPLAQVTMLYFCGVMVAHMINLASGDGVPVPTVLVTAARLLKDATEGSTTASVANTANVAMVRVQSALPSGRNR